MTVAIENASARAIAAGIKPRRYGSWYVAEHRIRGFRSYYKTLLFTAVGSPFMYLFALGVGLATLVDRQNALGGTSYLVFVAPALIASAAVTAAVEECTYPILMGFKWNPIFFGMNAAPISGNQIVNGVFIGVLARVLPTTVIFYLVMLVFGAVPSPAGILTIPISILSGFAFGLLIARYMARVEEDVGQPAFIRRFIAVLARLLPTTLIYYLVMLVFGAVPSPLGVLDIPIAILTGMAFGLVIASYIATVEQDVGQPAFIQRFIVIPLFLFSGTFFPLTQMPIFLRWIGWISPLWHGTELGRVVSYGAVEPGWLTLVHVLYPIGLCVYGWRRTQVVVARRLNK